MTSARVPVLLLGSGLTLLGVLRVLGRRGVPLYVLSRNPGTAVWSRWYACAPGSAAGVGEEALETCLGQLALGSAVLIPCSDDSARRVSSLPESLASRFPSCTSPPEVLDRLLDKGRLLDLMKGMDIPHPRTALVQSPGDLETALGMERPGVFLKPRDSQDFLRRFGVKAVGGEPEELKAALEELIRAGVPVMVQEYVPGPARNHYFVDGFIDASGRVRARFARRRLRMYPSDFGNSSAMVSVPLSEVAEGVDIVESLVRGAGYRGIFSAEMKRDERDGALKILEVNARPWWYVEFAARCGVDVCHLAYRDALRLPLRDIATYEVGRTLIYPYYDAQACMELWRGGERRLPEWTKLWLTADRPFFSWDDPGPAGRGSLDFLLGFLKRRLGSLGLPVTSSPGGGGA